MHYPADNAHQEIARQFGGEVATHTPEGLIAFWKCFVKEKERVALSKPYQIENRRAMQRFEASLRENQEPVQLLLPSVEIALAMKQGVGALIRQAGLQLMQ